MVEIKGEELFSFQRTQRVPNKARHPLASNPPEFARVLTEKLERVKLEQELHEREARNLSASAHNFEVCISVKLTSNTIFSLVNTLQIF